MYTNTQTKGCLICAPETTNRLITACEHMCHRETAAMDITHPHCSLSSLTQKWLCRRVVIIMVHRLPAHQSCSQHVDTNMPAQHACVLM